jgi:hypothetical protein
MLVQNTTNYDNFVPTDENVTHLVFLYFSSHILIVDCEFEQTILTTDTHIIEPIVAQVTHALN